MILPTCHTIMFMRLSLQQNPPIIFGCLFTCCSQLFLKGIYKNLIYVRENKG